ncbi:unnamed protein product [Paramecium sonneborni]|uniref:ABC3 transporter permease C-terminal domain-containing protein n=1 Tax=Paramecium sonneborni TaxID=65129 RepID=A0A8S1JU45_9CILI|nr:unnamed protein product [Paramecium sonneborni]
MDDTLEEENNNAYLYMGLWQKITVTIRIIVEYIYSDIRKKPRSFKIGLFTIYLVVMFLALIQSAFSLSPLIFIQLAETTAGDTDLVFTPIPSENRTKSNTDIGPQNSNFQASQNLLNGFSLVNQTEIVRITKNIDEIFDTTPRWLMIGNLENPKENISKISDTIRSFFLLIDSQKEISIGLGRRLETDIINNNEVLVTSSGLRGLNATIGDILNLNIDIIQFLSTYVITENNNNDPESFIMAAFDTYLNGPLELIYGQNFTKQEYTGLELKVWSTWLIVFTDFLDNNPDQKEQIRENFKNQINQAGVSNDQNEVSNTIFDILFAQELGYFSRILGGFIQQLGDNDIVSIYLVEQIMAEIIADSLDFDIQLKVKESIKSPKGKWADGLGNIVVMDYRNATIILREAFLIALNNTIEDYKINSPTNSVQEIVAFNIPVEDLFNFIRNYTDSIKLEEYTLTSNLLVKDRVTKYTSKDNIDNFVLDVSNQFFDQVGYDFPVKITVPLATAIKQYLLLGNFVDNLVVSATFLLLMLSVLLIYSLMIGDVEEKTYEFGMLRALGFQKWWLIILLLLQAFTFAIPGLILGLITCYILNSLISMFIFDSAVLMSSYDIAKSAIGLSIGLGLFIPLASNILPIVRALSKTLRDSLDLYHRTINDILVNVIKLEKMGISIDQFFTAALLVIMGFVSYYLIPMAFIFSNIQLALAVINIILIVMIIGFTLLANILEEPFEKAILKLILCIFKKDRNLEKIIFKNLEAHYSRNWKTTLMYTIALAFLIFAGAGFALQTSVITDVLQSFLGADISIQALQSDKRGLDEYNLRMFLNKTMNEDPTFLYDYSFTTLMLSQIPEMPNSHFISTLAKFPFKKIFLGGVEENYLRSCLEAFYIPNSYDQNIKYGTLIDGAIDGVSGIYDRSDVQDREAFYDPYSLVGSQLIRKQWYKDLSYEKPNLYSTIDREINIVVPQGYIYEAGINVDTPSILYVDRRLYRTNVRHMATKVPGYFFSSYRSLVGNGLISMEDALYIVNDFFQGDIRQGNLSNQRANLYFQSLPKNLTYGLPKDNLQIRFARQTTEQERVDFCNALRNYFLNEQTLLFDVITLKKEAEDTFYFITIFYVLVAIVAMTLSFFLILVSFVSNVKDNSWEFGVLRAVGLNKQQITRVYIYEAISLITASGLIGTIVGLVVAITLTLQILMFTEFSFKFIFPTEIFLITFLGGFITATGASYLAVLEIRDKSISTILKGLQ